MFLSRLLKDSLKSRKSPIGAQIGSTPGNCCRRSYYVLAIESSCDDACVAVLEQRRANGVPYIVDESKETLKSASKGGIVPTDAHEFHQEILGKLVKKVCERNGFSASSPPELVCCTRGPGLVGSLSAGLQLSKGLSIAWNVPLIGVHHMLGHILAATLSQQEMPRYPYLSFLCSGGHTMLVKLSTIADHKVVANTQDIAVGDCIDKCSREIGIKGDIIGKELERYVDTIPSPLKKEFYSIDTRTPKNKFNFALKLPLKRPKHDRIPSQVDFAFSSFLSSIRGYKDKYYKNSFFDEYTKQFMALKLQETVFDHLIDRLNVLFLKHGSNSKLYGDCDSNFEDIRDFILSGGVASNKRLREKLSNELKTEALCHYGQEKALRFHFPEISACTDNAVMIGLAGIRIFEDLRRVSDIGILPIRKWPMSDLLTVSGWHSRQV